MRKSAPEKEGVNPPVNIEVLSDIRIHYQEPIVITHKRRVRDKLYTWKEKRITLPPDWPENELVYYLSETDFNKLVSLINRLLRDKGY